MFLSDDPTSVLDAYGLTKILYKAFSINNIATIVNNVIDKEDGMEILKVFNLATTNFLKKEFPNVGIIYYEK
jgi:MinD-like ATPase involved in chromosome partitioning or flagellar assembly